MSSIVQPPTRNPRRTTITLAAVLLSATAITGCTANETSERPAQSSGGDSVQSSSAVSEGRSGVVRTKAAQMMQVTEVHEETGQTLLEGPVFDAEGRLYLVDVTAPSGEPKVLRVDLESKEVSSIHSDDSGAYTSAQISPHDGRLHLTDYRTGRIISMTLEGEDLRTVFEGEVAGRTMHPDDLAFGPDGSMYVSDSSPMSYPEGGEEGRVVRIGQETGKATVLASGLPNPNGISLSGGGRELWVGMLDGSRIDRLMLDESGTSVERGHTAVHISGGGAQPDSNAIDAEGNIYQGMHGRPEIRVYSPEGEHLRTIRVPASDGGLQSATNIAIRPGTTEAYATVSGESGGFLYRFEASADGVRASNGG